MSIAPPPVKAGNPADFFLRELTDDENVVHTERLYDSAYMDDLRERMKRGTAPAIVPTDLKEAWRQLCRERAMDYIIADLSRSKKRRLIRRLIPDLRDSASPRRFLVADAYPEVQTQHSLQILQSRIISTGVMHGGTLMERAGWTSDDVRQVIRDAADEVKRLLDAESEGDTMTE